MPEMQLGNSPSSETNQTANLCPRLSGPQGEGTAWRGTEASGLGVPRHGLRTSAHHVRGPTAAGLPPASADGDAEAHRTRSGG